MQSSHVINRSSIRPMGMMKHLFLSILFSFSLTAPAQLDLPGSLQPANPFAAPELAKVAAPAKKGNTRIQLLSDHERVSAGSRFLLGLRLDMDPGWHTYWTYPGDSGLSTAVDWTLPAGFQVGEPQWPLPKRYVDAGLVSFGYEKSVLILFPVTVDTSVTPGAHALSLEATWLECKGVCLPGKGKASIQITVADTASPAPALQQAFAKGKAAIPMPSTGWTLASSREGDGMTLRLQIPADSPLKTPTAFFPRNELLWKLAADFELSVEGNEILIRGSLEDDPVLPEQIDGVVAFEEGALDLAGIAVPVLAEPSTDNAPVASPEAGSDLSLLGALGLAFLGGLLLNLMPCVFPVLGLKISGFVHQAHGDMSKAKLHGWVFALGIFLSMQVLAIIVSSLNLAWGQQFQSVGMNIGIALLFFALALNLFGVFEIGTRMTTVGGSLQMKQGYAGSFYSGLLVTLAATPCTAPLLGVALGWAAGQPPFTIFLFFTALSAGMAAPYVILSSIPALMEKIPAPGPWMETFRQSMGFLIAAFVLVWIWVLAGQIPVAHLLIVLSSLFLIALAAWIYGKWCVPHRSKRSRMLSAILSLFLAVGAVAQAINFKAPETERTTELQQQIDAGLPLVYTDLSDELARSLQQEGTPVHWFPWTADAVESLQAGGTPVFVDFTARWCLTCQVNKKTTLRKTEVMKMFEEAGVVTLMADWTNRDPAIFDAIRSLGRNGVPVYALYNGVPGESPQLLPETLSPQIIKAALDKLNN